MLQDQSKKLPQVFSDPKMRFQCRNYFIAISIFFVIFFSFSLFGLSVIQNKLTPDEPKSNDTTHVIKFDYPPTAPAHISNEFKNWSLNPKILSGLWKAVKNSPVNPKTGRHFLFFSVANQGMINFVLNSLCSLSMTGIPNNYRITVALDQESYDAVNNIGQNVLLLESNYVKQAVNNRKLIDFYNIVKVRPTILHQLLLWNVEAILVDADTVFLENPLDLFNDEADFEVQSDSRIWYKIPYQEMPVPWDVNLGYYKLHPTPTVMKLIPLWFEKMYTSPKIQDQSALRKVLKPYPTSWLNNETIIVDTSKLLGNDYPNLTLRYLDPILITNAGGLYQEKGPEWRKEALMNNITRPKMIHFFHLGFIRQKVGLINDQHLIYYDKHRQCLTKEPDGATHFKAWS